VKTDLVSFKIIYTHTGMERVKIIKVKFPLYYAMKAQKGKEV
jgi:hypothetical protein